MNRPLCNFEIKIYKRLTYLCQIHLKMRVIKRIVVFVILFFILISCRERKMEFIESKAIKGLVLVKNPPPSPYEMGKMIEHISKIKKRKILWSFMNIPQTLKNL